jgi:drug/metabolite transporter (DMT)-like permease
MRSGTNARGILLALARISGAPAYAFLIPDQGLRGCGQVWWSLVSAIAAAWCYGFASVIQALAARGASRGGAARVDPRLVVRMLSQWRFIASLGLDFLGLILQVVALRRLPLFAVQAAIAASLAVTAIFAAWLIHQVLADREWVAVAGVCAGVALLGTSAGAVQSAPTGNEFRIGLITGLGALLVLGMLAGRLPDRFRTPALGAVAGLGYGVVAVSARILTNFAPLALAKDPATYTLAVAGVVSFLFYASALERGQVTVASAATVLTETVLPALIGVLFLGDHPRRGLEAVAAAGFALAVAGAVMLARFAEGGADAAAAGGSA